MFAMMNSSAAYCHSPRSIVAITIVAGTPIVMHSPSIRFLTAR